MKITYEKQAIKTLAKMPAKIAKQIVTKINDFAKNKAKSNMNIKAMKGVENGYRLRQGNWRAIFIIEIKKDKLRVIAIKPRGGAYK